MRRGGLIVEGKGEGKAGEGLILIQDSSLLGQLSFFLQPLSSYNSTSSYKHPFLRLFLFSNTFRSFNSRAPFQSSLFFFHFSLFESQVFVVMSDSQFLGIILYRSCLRFFVDMCRFVFIDSNILIFTRQLQRYCNNLIVLRYLIVNDCFLRFRLKLTLKIRIIKIMS